ncbi:hypothetical protein GL263_17990 [Streptomyces durbertensis]|uniref:DUF7848 domain-containing protein n=1 Tax=Streptomyces durbertensis TaxID=2448886 RepID=A0ABR6EJE7_9ACTN|nr:hypothetical protein [Streptomyces durbertensis]MBB1245440.1 hypothetical protein [Streptomyces durbertensis]
MSSHRIYRYVEHVIDHAPEGGVVYETFCVAGGCAAGSGPQPEQDVVQDWALRHARRTGHHLFRRTVTDHARVTRTGPVC